MLPIKESGLSLKEKNNKTSVFLLSNCPKVLKLVHGLPVKLLLMSSIHAMMYLSCLYFPQDHYFISTRWRSWY